MNWRAVIAVITMVVALTSVGCGSMPYRYSFCSASCRTIPSFAPGAASICGTS